MLLTVLFNIESDNTRIVGKYCIVCREIGQNLTNLIFFAHIPSFWSFSNLTSPCSSLFAILHRKRITHISRHILFYMLTQNPKIKFTHISFFCYYTFPSGSLLSSLIILLKFLCLFFPFFLIHFQKILKPYNQIAYLLHKKQREQGDAKKKKQTGKYYVRYVNKNVVFYFRFFFACSSNILLHFLPYSSITS